MPKSALAAALLASAIATAGLAQTCDPIDIFADPVGYTAGMLPFAVAIGDLDGDGDGDLAVANFDTASVSVLLNHGDGKFDADAK